MRRFMQFLHLGLWFCALIMLAVGAYKLYVYPFWLSTRASKAPAPQLTTVEPQEAPNGPFLLEIPKTGLKWRVGIVEEKSEEPCGIPKRALDRHGIVISPMFSYPGERGVTVLAAHRYRLKPFATLDRLVPGDPILVHLSGGELVRYRVERLQVVLPSDTVVLRPVRPGRAEMRIVTCLLGSNAKRLIIYAAMTGGE